MSKRMFFMILVCQGLLIACSSHENKSPIDIEESYTNRQILLKTPSFFNTFRTNDPIYLELTSNSNNEIVFPNNYNLRMFEKSAGEWIEILEFPTVRLPAGDVIFAPNKKLRATFYTDPDLADSTRAYQMRIYIIGNMKTEEGIRQVAAYVDLKLRP